MFIRKMLQSDWLDYGLWTTIHFRTDTSDHLYGFRSKLKHRIFGKMAEKLSTEVIKVSYVRKMVGKFSEPETIDYYIFSRVFHQFLNNWLDCLYDKFNPSVLPLDLPAVGLYVRTSGFIFSADSPTSY